MSDATMPVDDKALAGRDFQLSSQGNPLGFLPKNVPLGLRRRAIIPPFVAAGPFAVEEMSMWSARSGGPTPAVPGTSPARTNDIDLDERRKTLTGAARGEEAAGHPGLR